MQYKFTRGAIALSLLSVCLSVHAEETNQQPIIVSASRTAQTVDQALASVDVITREEIEQSQARDLPELLRLQAGVDISRSGGYGSLTNVFLRGTNANHTLFLIDGMRVSSATTGTFPLEYMNLDNIDRIEIVRGPRSTQYGSEAIGGIIQIFTRKQQTQNVRVSYGSYNTREASAGAAFGEQTKVSLNVAYKQSDGFSATNPDAGFYYNDDNDAYRNTTFNFSVTSPVSNTVSLSLTGWGSNAEIEFDQGTISGDGTSDTVNQTMMVNLDHQVTGSWSQRFSVGYNHDDIVTSSDFPTDIETKRDLFEWQHDIAINNAMLAVLGYSGYRDNARNIDKVSDTIVFDEKVDNHAVFASLQYGFSQQDLMYTIRNDKHSNFGNHVTHQLSWGSQLTSATRIVATYGTAFRAPTTNELFHPGYDFGGVGNPADFFYAGNANLQPEKSTGGDLSFKWQINHANHVDITYFGNKIENLISYAGTNFQAINIASARTTGFEIKHDWHDGNWLLNTAVTLQKAYDEETRTDLIRRPRRKLAMGLTRLHGSTASTKAELIASSERLDGFSPNYQTLNSYAIVNLATQFEINKGVVFEGRIENLFDKEYELAYGYNTPGRSGYIGLRYQLN